MDILSKISRQEAYQTADNMLISDIRQISNRPKMEVMECALWRAALKNYIEVVYNGNYTNFSNIVSDYNSQTVRRFKKSDGKEGTIVPYRAGAILRYRSVLFIYTQYLESINDDGKGCSANNFKKFLAANYTEI